MDPRIFQIFKLAHKDLKISMISMCKKVVRLEEKFTKAFLQIQLSKSKLATSAKCYIWVSKNNFLGFKK